MNIRYSEQHTFKKSEERRTHILQLSLKWIVPNAFSFETLSTLADTMAKTTRTCFWVFAFFAGMSNIQNRFSCFNVLFFVCTYIFCIGISVKIKWFDRKVILNGGLLENTFSHMQLVLILKHIFLNIQFRYVVHFNPL